MKLAEISKQIREAHEGAIKRSASIAVFWEQNLLMGKRRDTGRWTLPGGGVNMGETPYDGACRELEEEAGIPPQALYPIGSKQIQSRYGDTIQIFSYKLETYDHPTFTENDPDKEVAQWHWIDTVNGIPSYVRDNLQHKRNVTLEMLGIL